MEFCAFASTGSKENSGSRPSLTRTCSAMERYSKFTEAAGSMVGATPTWPVLSSNTRQQRPSGTGRPARVAAAPALWGTRSAFQPMSYSACRSIFFRFSFSTRFSSSPFMSRMACCAAHSACTQPFLSWLSYMLSPRGRWQAQQSLSSSPSESRTLVTSSFGAEEASSMMAAALFSSSSASSWRTSASGFALASSAGASSIVQGKAWRL
mmetsp:Transcript_77911/g.174685  ORF Transcript_77911/g.174685 Transcript_77911/m.174685 type:complete len:209 (-) Transcript_77911:830-1456(-)